MKEVYYEHGPDAIEVGGVGRMERGASVSVDDKIAERLLKKKGIVFKVGKRTPAADKTGKEA